MAQESYADFSIIKAYFEIKSRYEIDIQSYKDRIAALEDRIAAFEEQYNLQLEKFRDGLAARDGQLQAGEQKNQELNDKLKEKDEQLKNLGLQAYKMKTELEEIRNRPPVEEEKKGKFSIFK